jgi:hypothetical protein
LTYAPTAVGAVTGTLTLTSNAAGSPRTIALSGTGAAIQPPVLAWTLGSASNVFPDTRMGQVAVSSTYGLTNQGPGVVTLASLGFSGANATDYAFGSAMSSGCVAGTVLQLNQTCYLTVSFSPNAVGASSAQLNVVSNGTNPAAVALSGTGLSVAVPALSLTVDGTPWAADSPLTVSGSSTNPTLITLKNTGSAPLTLEGLAASNFFKVSLDPSCGVSFPVTLQPAGVCVVAVVIPAGTVGTVTDTLALTATPNSMSKSLSLSATADVGAGVASNNVGAGGCSLVDPEHARFDPLLLAMAALALGVLWLRRSRG